MAFLLQCGEKSCQDRRPRKRPKKGAPHSQSAGVLGYTTGGRGGTIPPGTGPLKAPYHHLKSALRTPHRCRSSSWLAAHLEDRAGKPSPLPGRTWDPEGFRILGGCRVSLPPTHPTPLPRRTRTAVEGVDPGEARQAPVAKRLHAGDSARQRLLGQMGNPTLIAQQRREGAGGRGAGRGGQTQRPKLQSSGWRKARQGNR